MHRVDDILSTAERPYTHSLLTAHPRSPHGAARDITHPYGVRTAQIPSAPHASADPNFPKPCSRRCFVCARTDVHPLGFQYCPRTFTLLRRSLAFINASGRLVLPDGSPLPMTRHAGGVAGHLIARYNRALRPPESSPRAAPPERIPYHTSPLPAPPRSEPAPTLNPSSPHDAPPARARSLRFPCAPCILAYSINLLRTALIEPSFRESISQLIHLINTLTVEYGGVDALRARLPPELIDPQPPPCIRRVALPSICSFS